VEETSLLTICCNIATGGNQREKAREKAQKKQQEAAKKKNSSAKEGNQGMTLEERRERYGTNPEST
jgi:hypothetical protein